MYYIWWGNIYTGRFQSTSYIYIFTYLYRKISTHLTYLHIYIFIQEDFNPPHIFTYVFIQEDFNPPHIFTLMLLTNKCTLVKCALTYIITTYFSVMSCDHHHDAVTTILIKC
jgi:hypothetical protein